MTSTNSRINAAMLLRSCFDEHSQLEVGLIGLLPNCSHSTIWQAFPEDSKTHAEQANELQFCLANQITNP
jgi:hypothetical protein